MAAEDQPRGAPPAVDGVLETVLYFTDEPRTEAFYSEVLGFRLVDREPGRSLFYRAGASMLLLFDATRASRSGRLPPHGAAGPIHVCFRVPRSDYETWRRHLESREVAILQDVTWSRGRSFYFEDPDRNLLEIADTDLWPA